MTLYILRGFSAVMGAIILVTVVMLSMVRQEPSSAYWLIDNGTLTDDYPNGLYRMMPDGKMRTPIMFDFAPRTNSSEIHWIAGKTKFLYPACVNGHLTIIRQPVLSSLAHWIPTNVVIDQSCPWEVIPSPNGNKLLLRIFDGGTHTLIITEADGSNPIVLTETFNSIVGSEIWSPKSEWVYFGAFSPSGGGIHRVSADGEEYERIAAIRFLDSPMWSSDGQVLTFITSGYFHQIDTATDQVRQLTESSSAEYQRAAMVKDEWILTVGADDEVRSLYRLRADGSEQSLLIYGILNARYVLTSEGTAIVLAGETNAQALFGVDVETGRRWSITPTAFWFSELIVGNDEEYAYFASTLEGANSVYRAKIDGSAVRHLYTLEDDDRNVNLQITPDHLWLLVTYVEDDFPTQRQHRVRISLRDGHVERLPDGTAPLASPLIDMAWNGWRLVGAGGMLMAISVGMPLIMGRLRRKI